MNLPVTRPATLVVTGAELQVCPFSPPFPPSKPPLRLPLLPQELSSKFAPCIALSLNLPPLDLHPPPLALLQELSSKFAPRQEERLLSVVTALLHRCYKVSSCGGKWGGSQQFTLLGETRNNGIICQCP